MERAWVKEEARRGLDLKARVWVLRRKGEGLGFESDGDVNRDLEGVDGAPTMEAMGEWGFCVERDNREGEEDNVGVSKAVRGREPAAT